MLVRPWHDELRHLERGECALLFDGYLHRLARQEAVCRRVLGMLAAAFLQRQAHRRLGFVRLGDCTRERFGISARELQSMARVATKLEVLPGLGRAFEAGTLAWTHVRLLIDVATPATEARWIAVARGLTVRALEQRMRDAAQTVGAPAADDEQTIEGEPVARIRLGCPRRLRALWRGTVELAGRMAGRPLALWEACEAIAAEGLASPLARRTLCGKAQDASPMMRMMRSPAGADATLDGNPAPGRAGACSGVDASSDGDGVRNVDASSRDVDPAVAAAIPDDIAALAAGIDDLDAFALDTRLLATLAAMHRVHWQTGRLLRLVFDLRLYRWLGFPTAARYVQERLGIGIRTAQGLVAVERFTGRAPTLAAAYERGAISALRALIIAPVLSETHEAAWVARATDVTVRRLGDEVPGPSTTRTCGPSASRSGRRRPARSSCRWTRKCVRVSPTRRRRSCSASRRRPRWRRSSRRRSPRSRRSRHRAGAASSSCSSTSGPNGGRSRAIGIPSSSATAGAARCRRAAPGGRCTIITSFSARARVATSARTA
jgi:hypothetical protein